MGGPARVVKLPASGEFPDHITEAVYRFSRYLSLEDHGDLLRQSFKRARAADGEDVHLFGTLKDVLGNEVSATFVVGRAGIPRRVTEKRRHLRAAAAPAGPLAEAGRAEEPAASSSRPWDKVVGEVKPAPDGFAWLSAESLDSFLLGIEIDLEPSRDFMVG